MKELDDLLKEGYVSKKSFEQMRKELNDELDQDIAKKTDQLCSSMLE